MVVRKTKKTMTRRQILWICLSSVLVLNIYYGMAWIDRIFHNYQQLTSSLVGQGGQLSKKAPNFQPENGQIAKPPKFIEPTFLDVIEDSYHTGTNMANFLAVFDELGFKQVQTKQEASLILSFYPGPKELEQLFSGILPNQKINLFPGIEPIVCKDRLMKARHPFVPTSFILPSRMKHVGDYLHFHPNTTFLLKDRHHHQVRMLYDTSPDFLKNLPSNTIAQVYLDKPYLFHNHRFDIGLFTLITSVNPLRLYLFEEEMFLRICEEQYLPFNASALGKYIAPMDSLHPDGDIFTPTGQHLIKMYESYNHSGKHLLQQHMRESGQDPDKLWSSIRSMLSSVFQKSKKHMQDMVSRFTKTSPRSFFEINRADFILDETGQAYLLEVNRRPYLGHWLVPNRREKSQKIIRDTYKMVGLDRPGVFRESVSVEEEIALFPPELCELRHCSQDGCGRPECLFCLVCLTLEDKTFLSEAFYEQTLLGGFRRTLPKPQGSQSVAEERKTELLLANKGAAFTNDLKLELWFIERCLKEIQLC